MELDVMTFNLRYNEPKDGLNAWPYRIDRAASIIKANAPHVLGVQEALYPMLGDLQQCLEDYNWIGEGRNGGFESEFCAIFYLKDRLEPVEHGQFWLSETPGLTGSKSWDSSCARTCTWAKFRDFHTNKQFLVYNTHLDHKGPSARMNGAILIYKIISEHRAQWSIPALLMGDMNCNPDSEPIRIFSGQIAVEPCTSDLRDVYEKVPKPIGKTFNGFQGLIDGEPIDYIFITPDIGIIQAKVDRTRYEGGYPSDHYPVVVKLKF